MPDAPSQFTVSNPRLQRAWDSTSLSALMKCPRYYEYTILNGWRGSTIDLEFGVLFASAVETFEKSRLSGKSKPDAQLDAVRYVVEQSGRYEPDSEGGNWIPWGGSYDPQWRCTGTEPYKNRKGNRAKCPYTHKGMWFPVPAPSVCGECGSAIEEAVNWTPINPAKDRIGLIRAVCWYTDDAPERPADGVFPYAFPDGTPGVELGFRLPLPWKTPDGEPYLLAGYLDTIVSFGNEMFIRDNKTTKKSLTKTYWQGFSPNMQVDLYDLAGSILYPALNLRGVMIDAAQLLVGGARFGSQTFYRNEALREETLNDIGHWIKLAEQYAQEGYWPMNKAQCPMCVFKGVCSKQPDTRERFLRADFRQQLWNPLEER